MSEFGGVILVRAAGRHPPADPRRPAGQARRHHPRQLPRHLPGTGARDQGRRHRPRIAAHVHAGAEPGQRGRRGARRPGGRRVRTHRAARGRSPREGRDLSGLRVLHPLQHPGFPLQSSTPALPRMAARRAAPGRPGADAQGGRARAWPRGAGPCRACRANPRLHHPGRLRARRGNAARAAPAPLRRQPFLHLERRVGALPRSALRARPRHARDRAAARAPRAAQPRAVAGQRGCAPAGRARSRSSATTCATWSRPPRPAAGNGTSKPANGKSTRAGRRCWGSRPRPAPGSHARPGASCVHPADLGRGRSRAGAPHPRRDRRSTSTTCACATATGAGSGSTTAPSQCAATATGARLLLTGAQIDIDRRKANEEAAAPRRERVLVELRGDPDHRRRQPHR